MWQMIQLLELGVHCYYLFTVPREKLNKQNTKAHLEKFSDESTENTRRRKMYCFGTVLKELSARSYRSTSIDVVKRCF